MSEKYFNALTDAVYEACKATGFEAEFTRGKYDFRVHFFAEEAGDFFVVQIYGDKVFEDHNAIKRYRKYDNVPYDACKNVDEIIEFMKQMFTKVGVVLEVPENETAA